MKERKIVQWALAYLAGAWVLVEFTSLLVAQFHWPEAVGQVVTILALFGFFVVLVIAWYHGEKGRQWVSGPELLIIALLLLICGGVLSMLAGRPSGERSLPATAPGDERPGVAVLPCQNISPNSADAHLAGGIHDEILLKLSKIASLRPIGRQSVEYYRDNPKPLPEMAAELGVAYLAECRVRKSGDRIRVTFQLMEGGTGNLVWAEDYDRDYTAENLFEMEGDIARQVATGMQAMVLPEERARIESRPTESLQAYDLYLLGRSYWNQFSEAGFQRAIELFHQAIDLDPRFARAHAGIADSYALLTQGWGRPPVEVFPEVRTAAERALDLDPSLAEAHASLGAVRLFYDWDMPGAMASLERAIELDPNYTNAHHWLAICHMARAQHADALEEARRALALDPLSAYINMNMGYFLYVAGDYEEAEAHYLEALRLFPEHPLIHAFLGLARIRLEKMDQAIADLERAVELAQDDTLIPLPFLGYVYGLAGREADARQTLQRLHDLDRDRFVNPDYFSVVHLGLGELDQAMEWLYRARRARTDWAFWFPVDPVAYPLHSDPRFVELVREVGLGEVLR
ncbi:MAG: tetratricopeptide repeat protein [Gemmatimonadota bacterium]|jgi:TolB-like protein/Tfp pilus assembly protein PilF